MSSHTDGDFLADDMSQLLALADALDSHEPAMIAGTFDAVVRMRGMDSLAAASGVERLRLRHAIQTLGPDDQRLLRELVGRLVAGLDGQAASAGADSGLRGP